MVTKLNGKVVNIKEFKKLIVHDDFDGIVCAVLLTTLNPELTVGFGTPEDIRSKRLDIDKGTILADLPYDDRCGLWFDHHMSNKGIGFHRIAPSAARVVYDVLSSYYPILSKYEELVKWCDKIDSAQYSKDDILNPKDYVLLGFTLTLDEEFDEYVNYRLHLISLLKTEDIDNILRDDKVKAKSEKVMQNIQKYTTMVKKTDRLTVYDSFYIFDLRGVDVDSMIKFITHTLLDDKVIGIFLTDSKEKEWVKFSMSYNYLLRDNFQPIDLSEVAKKYGGGGHSRAAGFSVPLKDVDNVLRELISFFKEKFRELKRKM